MKNKLKFLIKQSLKKKIGTKWFKAVNIILCILIVAMANIDRLITAFGGDFNKDTTVYVKDNVGVYDYLEPLFNETTKTVEDLKNYKVEKTDKSLKELKKNIKDTDNIIVEINSSDTNYISSTITTYDALDTISYQLLSNVLNQTKEAFVIGKLGLTENEIIALKSNIEITKKTTNPDLNDNAKAKDIISSGLIILFIVPFFIFITLLVQMLGAEINEEKSTKSMEIIISNVPPKYHFIAKISASSLFVIIQGALLFSYAILAMLARNLIGVLFGSGIVSSDVSKYLKDIINLLKDSGIIDLLVKGLPFIILLFIVNILAYAIIAGVLASMTTNIEDYQQLQSPIMIIMMMGYFIAIMASTFDGSIFIKIVSFIPLLSALVAPVIYLLGQTTIIELIISLIICMITVAILYIYGLKIYKVGILNYSSSDLWKKMLKSLKEK